MTPERIAELLNLKDDYRELRMAVGKMKHSPPKCDKCFWNEGGRCYVGNPQRTPMGTSLKLAPGIYDIPAKSDDRPLEVIAYELIRNCDCVRLEYAILDRLDARNPDVRDRSSGRIWRRFAYMDAAEQIVCCLMVMEETR